MLHGRSIVCLSTIDWDFLWQEHQATMSIFAREGNRVLFIENTGVRAPRPRDGARVWSRLRRWASGEGRFGSPLENLWIYSPLALPFPYSPAAQRWNRAIVAGGIRRWLRRNGFDDVIFWSFLPTQFAIDLRAAVSPATSIYYCTDKLSETSRAARRLTPYERRFAAGCDLVFASAEKLACELRLLNPSTHIFPMGVSLEKFEAAWSGRTSEPLDLVGLERPIVGHVGSLRPCVDQPLLEGLARALPGMTFVFVGPEYTSFAALKRLPNVRFLGAKPHESVPAYIRGFDVCLLPYVVDSFTDNISPAILNEYLALGKPVVASDLHEIRRFDEEFRGVVTIASGVVEFREGIERALGAASQADSARRRAAAEANSWQSRTEAMSELIETQESRKG